jgi:hypothetical protein
MPDMIERLFVLASFASNHAYPARLRAAGLANGSPVSARIALVRCRPIASDDDVNVERMELDAAANPPGIFGGHKGRT